MNPRAAMKQSILKGALVGVALGVTATAALVRGWVELPWERSEDAIEHVRPVHTRGHDDGAKTLQIDEATPRRIIRPGSSSLGHALADAAPILSRS